MVPRLIARPLQQVTQTLMGTKESLGRSMPSRIGQHIVRTKLCNGNLSRGGPATAFIQPPQTKLLNTRLTIHEAQRSLKESRRLIPLVVRGEILNLGNSCRLANTRSSFGTMAGRTVSAAQNCFASKNISCRNSKFR